MHLTVGSLALLALYVVHTSSAPPFTTSPLTPPPFTTSPFTTPSFTTPSLTTSLCYFENAFGYIDGPTFVYLDGPAPVSGRYRCLRNNLYTRDLAPAIFRLTLDMKDGRKLEAKDLTVMYKKNNNRNKYTTLENVESFDPQKTKVFPAGELESCKCRSIRVTGLDVDNHNGVFVLTSDLNAWIEENYSNSSDSSHLKQPFPKQSWVLREKPLEADGSLSRLLAANWNASTSSDEREDVIDDDELSPHGVHPGYPVDDLERSPFSSGHGSILDDRRKYQIEQDFSVPDSHKHEKAYEQSWDMDRYTEPAGRAKRENEKFMQVNSLEKRQHNLTFSTDRGIKKERVYKSLDPTKTIINDHVSKNLKKRLGIEQTLELNGFLNYYMSLEQEIIGKPQKSSKQKLFGVAKSLVYLPSRDKRELQASTKSYAGVSEQEFGKNSRKSKHFLNVETTTMPAFTEEVDLKMEGNLGKNIKQRGTSEKMGNVEKKMAEQFGSAKTGNRFDRKSGSLAEPNLERDDDPNYEMKYYDSSVRIVKDDEEDAWLILEGEELVAVSDDSSLCPDTYWGDWWQVRSQGSDVTAGVRDQTQDNDTDKVPNIITVPEDHKGPLLYEDILSAGPRGEHQHKNTDSGGQTRTVLVRKKITLSCELIDF